MKEEARKKVRSSVCTISDKSMLKYHIFFFRFFIWLIETLAGPFIIYSFIIPYAADPIYIPTHSLSLHETRLCVLHTQNMEYTLCERVVS